MRKYDVTVKWGMLGIRTLAFLVILAGFVTVTIITDDFIPALLLWLAFLIGLNIDSNESPVEVKRSKNDESRDQ